MKNDDIATAQAMSLVALACEQQEATYISQLQTIDRPHAVINAMCELLVRSVPYAKHGQLAADLRDQIAAFAAQ